MIVMKKWRIGLASFILCCAIAFHFIGIPDNDFFRSQDEDNFWRASSCQNLSVGFFSEATCCPDSLPKVKNQKFICTSGNAIESNKLLPVAISRLEENLAGAQPSVKIEWMPIKTAKAYQVFRREYYSAETVVNLPPIKSKHGKKPSKRQVVHGPGWGEWTTTAILYQSRDKKNKSKSLITAYLGLSKPKKFIHKNDSIFFTDNLKLGDTLRKASAFEYRIVSYYDGVAIADSGAIVVGEISDPNATQEPQPSPNSKEPTQADSAGGKKPLDNCSSLPGCVTSPSATPTASPSSSPSPSPTVSPSSSPDACDGKAEGESVECPGDSGTQCACCGGQLVASCKVISDPSGASCAISHNQFKCDDCSSGAVLVKYTCKNNCEVVQSSDVYNCATLDCKQCQMIDIGNGLKIGRCEDPKPCGPNERQCTTENPLCPKVACVDWKMCCYNETRCNDQSCRLQNGPGQCCPENEWCPDPSVSPNGGECVPKGTCTKECKSPDRWCYETKKCIGPDEACGKECKPACKSCEEVCNNGHCMNTGMANCKSQNDKCLPVSECCASESCHSVCGGSGVCVPAPGDGTSECTLGDNSPCGHQICKNMSCVWAPKNEPGKECNGDIFKCMHFECNSEFGYCMEAEGEGASSCEPTEEDNLRCQNEKGHLECNAETGSCDYKEGPGVNGCDTRGYDPKCGHTECKDNGYCGLAPGQGDNKCDPKNDLDPKCGHYICNMEDKSCDREKGSGVDQCTEDNLEKCGFVYVCSEGACEPKLPGEVKPGEMPCKNGEDAQCGHYACSIDDFFGWLSCIRIPGVAVDSCFNHHKRNECSHEACNAQNNMCITVNTPGQDDSRCKNVGDGVPCRAEQATIDLSSLQDYDITGNDSRQDTKPIFVSNKSDFSVNHFSFYMTRSVTDFKLDGIAYHILPFENFVPHPIMVTMLNEGKYFAPNSGIGVYSYSDRKMKSAGCSQFTEIKTITKKISRGGIVEIGDLRLTFPPEGVPLGGLVVNISKVLLSGCPVSPTEYKIDWQKDYPAAPDVYYNPRLDFGINNLVPDNSSQSATNWCKRVPGKIYNSGKSYLAGENPQGERFHWNGSFWEKLTAPADYPRYYECKYDENLVNPKVILNEISIPAEEDRTHDFIEIKNLLSSELNLAGYQLKVDSYSPPDSEIPFAEVTEVYSLDLSDKTIPAQGYFLICPETSALSNCDLRSNDAFNSVRLIASSVGRAGLRIANSTEADTFNLDTDFTTAKIGAYTDLPAVSANLPVSLDRGFASGRNSFGRYPDGDDSNSNSADFSVMTQTPKAVNTNIIAPFFEIDWQKDISTNNIYFNPRVVLNDSSVVPDNSIVSATAWCQNILGKSYAKGTSHLNSSNPQGDRYQWNGNNWIKLPTPSDYPRYYECQ